jgi:basic membrane protein A
MGQKLLGLGADIIFPVAGPTGLGTAQRVQEQGEAWVIGVDNDWMEAYAQYADVVLTSAMKYFDATTYAVIELAYLDNFSGGIYIGSLANGGVGLGTVAASVPAELLTKIEQIKADIIAGTIVVTP